MSNIIEFKAKEKYQIDYIFDDEKNVIAVTHPDWPFRIMRKGDQIAMVCEDSDEPFGELNRDVFNTILMCWLLIDDPKLIDNCQPE